MPGVPHKGPSKKTKKNQISTLEIASRPLLFVPFHVRTLAGCCKTTLCFVALALRRSTYYLSTPRSSGHRAPCTRPFLNSLLENHSGHRGRIPSGYAIMTAASPIFAPTGFCSDHLLNMRLSGILDSEIRRVFGNRSSRSDTFAAQTA